MSRGRFKPGQSGNPGGRPKAVKDVEALAREYTEAAIVGLGAIAGNAKAPAAARVAAYNALLDRGWGKPRQPLAHSGSLAVTHEDALAALATEPDDGGEDPPD